MPDRIPRVASREQFVRDAATSETNQCILWPEGWAAVDGYGKLKVGGQQWRAHRLALTLAKGPPPSPKHEAAHAPLICRQPGCINPRHLDWKTRAENDADKCLDGTYLHGEDHPNARLSDDDVREIRADGRVQRVIAAEWGLHENTVQRIKTRRRRGGA